MFTKNEKRRKNPALIMTLGALAAVGAASIIRSGKAVVHNVCCKLRGIVHVADDGE